MSKVDVLLGLQWGDEGKGKVVDFLAPKYEIIARFQGGPNAGHTLEFDGKKHVLHQIPSGIFHPEKINIIGNGVVLDPITFKKEINALKPFDVDPHESLVVSTKAQIILPTHRLLDQAYELAKGKAKIGSTLRGIGPTYQDKMARVGMRVGDVLEKSFDKRYEQLKERHLRILDHHDLEFDLESAENEFFSALEVLRSFQIRNTEYLINQYLTEGRSVLAEGAQGSLLDIDFGSYPFVTSSNTIAAGACTGLGVSPGRIGEVFGIFKSYCTRVGSGPFPTELHDEEGESLRQKGSEFGATTGRPRRCGWLDLPALKYVTMLNGVSQLFMMKVDVLSGLDEIKVCTAYKRDGKLSEEVPSDFNEDWSVDYHSLQGWNDSNIKSYDEFSEQLKAYIGYIEEFVGVPINMISIGPDRKETIMKEDPVSL
jgi:adenylosuccinate synthase